MTLRYFGNSPYCAANSLSVIFGDAGLGAATIEVASGSPFGMTIHLNETIGGEEIIYFASPKWTPEYGLTNALKTVGWECDRAHGSVEESVDILRKATQDAPVLVGPVEMGLMPYFPGLGQAVGADHLLVVLGVEGDLVRAHDVIGWPFVTIPLDALVESWTGTTFAYPVDAYSVRHNFRPARKIDTRTALRTSMETAIDLLDVPGIAEAGERAAQIVEGGLSNLQYKFLVEFQVQAGARRLADASALYREIGADGPAAILEKQAMLIGSLQLSLMTHEDARAAATFRALGPTYAQLLAELRKEIGG